MVNNDRREGFQLGEERSFDIIAYQRETVVKLLADQEERDRQSEEEERKSKEQQQTHNLDASSSSSSCSVSLSSLEASNKRLELVVNEPIRAEPVSQIIKPVKKGKKPVRREPVVRGEIPEWLVNLMREENGVDAKMIIEKDLTMSDLLRDQNRLLIPFKQIIEIDFLNERELKIIEDNYNNRKSQDHKGVNVILVDSSGAQWMLRLRRWDMKSSSNYVLCSGWSNVFLHNELREGQTIRLWSFHSEDKLYFALVPLPPAPVQANDKALDLVPAPALDMDQSLALVPAVSQDIASSALDLNIVPVNLDLKLGL